MLNRNPPEFTAFLVPLVITLLIWYAISSTVAKANPDAPGIGRVKSWWLGTAKRAQAPVQLGLCFVTASALFGLGVVAAEDTPGGYSVVTFIGFGVGFCLIAWGLLMRHRTS